MDHHSNLTPSDHSVDFASHPDETFIPQGQHVPFINGAKWIDQSFKMVFQQPKSWLFVILLFLAVDLISEYVLANSSASRIITLFLTTLISAGVFCVADTQRLTGKADLQVINRGFSERFGGIIGVILIQIAIIIIGLIISLVILNTPFLDNLDELIYAAQTNNQERVTNILLMIGINRLILAFLFFIVSMIFAEMFTRFAIPLMMLQNYSVGQALKSSFQGCLKNIPAAAVYIISLIILVAIYLALSSAFPALEDILFILWTIVIVPCTYIATYVAFRDIFHLS